MVVACGSVESPALLLRSGIGGPAVGKHLRLHPAYVVMGVYDEPVEGWRGQIQSLVSDDLRRPRGRLRLPDRGDRRCSPGLISADLPVGATARTHKELMQAFKWQAPFITVARDHGVGRGGARRPRPRRWCAGASATRWTRGWRVRAHVELCRLHQAAGRRRRSSPPHQRELRWRARRRLRRVPRAGGGRLVRAQRRGLLHRAPDGLVPDGLRSRRLGRRRPRRAARHQGRVDRRRVGVPDGAGREPDDLDHVARPPHGGRDA